MTLLQLSVVAFIVAACLDSLPLRSEELIAYLVVGGTLHVVRHWVRGRDREAIRCHDCLTAVTLIRGSSSSCVRCAPCAERFVHDGRPSKPNPRPPMDVPPTIGWNPTLIGLSVLLLGAAAAWSHVRRLERDKTPPGKLEFGKYKAVPLSSFVDRGEAQRIQERWKRPGSGFEVTLEEIEGRDYAFAARIRRSTAERNMVRLLICVGTAEQLADVGMVEAAATDGFTVLVPLFPKGGRGAASAMELAAWIARTASPGEPVHLIAVGPAAVSALDFVKGEGRDRVRSAVLVVDGPAIDATPDATRAAPAGPWVTVVGSIEHRASWNAALDAAQLPRRDAPVGASTETSTWETARRLIPAD